jgi:hypothetical protein
VPGVLQGSPGSPALSGGVRVVRALLQRESALAGSILPDYCVHTLNQARKFVDARWGAVCAICEALRERFEVSGERAELSGEEVYALVRSAPVCPRPARGSAPR